MDVEDLVVVSPDPLAAMLAMQAASDVLSSASERFGQGDYEDAFAGARDSMRLVSSALLLRDGYVAATLDATLSYLQFRYEGMLPLEAWAEAERTLPAGPTLAGALAALLGRNKRIGREGTERALAAAESFFASARSLLGVR